MIQSNNETVLDINLISNQIPVILTADNKGGTDDYRSINSGSIGLRFSDCLSFV